MVSIIDEEYDLFEGKDGAYFDFSGDVDLAESPPSQVPHSVSPPGHADHRLINSNAPFAAQGKARKRESYNESECSFEAESRDAPVNESAISKAERNRLAAEKARQKKKGYVQGLEVEVDQAKAYARQLQMEMAVLAAENRLLKEQNQFLQSLVRTVGPADPFAASAPVSGTNPSPSAGPGATLPVHIHHVGGSRSAMEGGEHHGSSLKRPRMQSGPAVLLAVVAIALSVSVSSVSTLGSSSSSSYSSSSNPGPVLSKGRVLLGMEVGEEMTWYVSLPFLIAVAAAVFLASLAWKRKTH